MELLPRLVFDGPEALVVTLSPEGDALFRTPQAGAQLVPERACALACDLLSIYAPELMQAIEREVRAQRLRLVQGRRR